MRQAAACLAMPSASKALRNLALAACLIPCYDGPARAQDASAMRAQRTALSDQLANSPFGRPLVLASTQSADDLRGEVYAIAPESFAVVGPSLNGIDRWCDILMSHLLVKGCTWQGRTLALAVASKFDQLIDSAHKVDFEYSVLASGPDYVHVQLNADSGPLGTKNYRIVLEAIPLDAKSSFVHMSYAYGFGMMAKIAMQSYLATVGRNKVGFSVTGRGPDGAPIHVGGVRGLIERNAMRYYLAIDAYLAATALPRAEQSEKRIQEWITNIERYPRQLHEMERDDYLVMKRKELAQQQASMAGKTSAR